MNTQNTSTSDNMTVKTASSLAGFVNPNTIEVTKNISIKIGNNQFNLTSEQAENLFSALAHTLNKNIYPPVTTPLPSIPATPNKPPFTLPTFPSVPMPDYGDAGFPPYKKPFSKEFID
jgi:hypothetical protein